VTRRQRTIALQAELEGKGLFTGQSVHLTLKPAPPDTGLIFRRVDLGEEAEIPATIEAVAKRFQRTTLARGEVCVETAEHLLAALAGLSIDNLYVELDAPELPGGDGSSADYVRLIRQAEIVEQDADRPVMQIVEPVTVQDGSSVVTALPGPEDELSLTYHLDYGQDGVIPPQIVNVKLTPESFAEDLATTRTFILESEVEDLRQRGYGPHASYEDLLVIGGDGPINNTYRFPDEPARHKILDLVGDLFLLNADLRCRVVAMGSGHALNHRFVRRLLEQAAHRGESAAAGRQAMDINQIMEVLPHRYPFLLVDRILSVEDNIRAVGIKNVSINEHFFQGHYPGTPIMPGVLIVEAMAQLSGVVLLKKLEHTGQVAVLLSMDKVKLRKTVHPGDQLRLEAEVIRAKDRRAQVNTRAWVAEELAAEAKIRFMLVPADQES